MKKVFCATALALLAGMPAIADPPATPHAVGVPHTQHTWLTVFRDVNYNGVEEVFETPRSTFHTDWPIRSIAVHPGDRWQVCGRPRFHEPCIILDRSVPDARLIGIDDQIGSARLAPETAAPGHN